MTRYRLIVEYDGTPFRGWQRQANGPSVQECLEGAIERFCGDDVTSHAAGRTDAGVHALGQAVHVDLSRDHPVDTVRNAVNFHLRPAPVAVLDVARVDERFHARFSATARHYRYRISNRAAPPTIARNRVWHVAAALDAAAMHEAAQTLVGRHDFTTFRVARRQSASPVRTLDRLRVDRRGEEIEVRASARSFLHRQVRAMTGALKLVGEGKWRAADVADALAARDRSRAGPTAPAQGLYLARVDYDRRPGPSAGSEKPGDPESDDQSHQEVDRQHEQRHQRGRLQGGAGDEPLIEEQGAGDQRGQQADRQPRQ